MLLAGFGGLFAGELLVALLVGACFHRHYVLVVDHSGGLQVGLVVHHIIALSGFFGTWSFLCGG